MGRIIATFNGPPSQIPPKWLLCDGNNGTPNLIDKFIKGAATLGEVGQTATPTHSHSLSPTAPAHSHGTTSDSGAHTHYISSTKTGASGLSSYQADKDYAMETRSHSHSTSSTSPSHSHQSGESISVPPYYKLCYIMAEDNNWNFPVGSVVMYAGTEEGLPHGWCLCNGTNGSLDLRNRFIKGGTTKGTIGEKKHQHSCNSGGAHTHSSGSVSFSHTHVKGAYDESQGGFQDRTTGYRTTSAGPSHSHSDGSAAGAHTHLVEESASNDPPYYKLAFIQRIF